MLVGIISLNGCAHLRAPSPNSGASPSNISDQSGQPRTIGDVIQQDGGKKADDANQKSKLALAVEHKNLTVNGIKLKNTQFDIPITINSRVEMWIDYFTGKGRDVFARYIERSAYFVPYIRPILKQNGMPEDLVYLSMIESGFNNLARSRAKAVGPWQFMSATGKRYGLMVNWWVDERRDISKSTLSAVKYLKDLYEMFQNWELAAAAYNAGEAKIARAIRQFGTMDFWTISRHRFLRPETRDYVPKIIAAAIISKNPEQFGFTAPHPATAKDELIAGDGELVKLIKADAANDTNEPESFMAEDSAENFAENFKDTDSDDISDIINSIAEDDSASKPTVPAPTPSATTVKQELAKSIPTPHISKTGEAGHEDLAEFEVQSPADLLKIARAAGLSYMTVKSLNPELLRWCTPPHTGSYRIKLPASTKDTFLSTYNHEAYPRSINFLTYKVRHGESLTGIARHFGIKVEPIKDLNRVPPQVSLRKGVNIVLPIPNDRSRSLSSLEVHDPPEHRRKHRRHRRIIRNVSGRKSSAAYGANRVSFRRRQTAQPARKRFITLNN